MKKKKAIGAYPLGVPTKHQDRGSALSYARRYVVVCTYQIAADDDDDGESGNEQLANKRSASTHSTPPSYGPVSTKPAAPTMPLTTPFENNFQRDTWVTMYLHEMDTCRTAEALKELRKQRMAYTERMKGSGNPDDKLALDKIADKYGAVYKRIAENPAILNDEIPF